MFFNFFNRKKVHTTAIELLENGRYKRKDISFNNAFDNYNASPRLAQVVDMVATTVGSLRMQEIYKNGEIKKNSSIIEFLDINNLSKLLEYSTKCLMLGGNAFIVVTGNINAMPVKFKTYPYNFYNYRFFDNQHIITLTTPDLKRYEFTRDENTGAWYNGSFSELIVITDGIGQNGVLGDSPQQSLYAKLNFLNKTDDANTNELLTGISSKAIIGFEGDLSEKAQIKLRKEVTNMNSGADNAGNILFVSNAGKTDIKMLNTSKKDADSLAFIMEAKDSIAERYLIPLSVINEKAATFNNLATGNIMYYQDVILPKFKNIVRSISDCFSRRKLIQNFYKLEHDKANTNILYQTALGEAANIQVKSGVWTRNQILYKIDGVGVKGLEGNDVVYEAHNQPKAVAGIDQEALDNAIKLQQQQNVKTDIIDSNNKNVENNSKNQ